MKYRTKHFALHELVSPDIYNARSDRAWELLNPLALQTLDELREHFGPITVNNWYWGGSLQFCGMRPFDCPVGAQWSMHKFGGAFDCHPHQCSPQKMHAAIVNMPERFPFLRVLENINNTPTWVHFDVRNHTKNGIWVVNP